MDIEIGGVSTGVHSITELFETEYDAQIAYLVLSGVRHNREKAREAYIKKEEERISNSYVYEWI